MGAQSKVQAALQAAGVVVVETELVAGEPRHVPPEFDWGFLTVIGSLFVMAR